jgi:hypothetical protein
MKSDLKINTMKLILKNIKTASVFTLMLFIAGCADDDENLPKVEANFTYTLNENTGVVTFLNTTENANDYLWDFGDGQTSEEISPVKKYNNGTYVVTLAASNVAGGFGAFTDTLNIKINELISLPANFDDPSTNYNATTFSGAEFQIVDNPDLSGSNTTASRVGEIRNNGTAFEGIFFNLKDPINLATQKSIGMNFWSNKPIDVLLKLEEGSASTEFSTRHKGTGWETIYFDFITDSEFSKMTLFVDAPGTSTGTFFIDDIFQTETQCWESDLLLPIKFDCEGTAYIMETFGGVTFEVIANPEVSGINNLETNVGQMVNSGAAFEGGAFTLDVPIDFSEAEAISLKLFSSVAVPVLLKLDGNSSIEASGNHSGTGWEKITFDYNTTQEFNQLTLLIDPSGTTSGTFYIDDIMLSAPNDKIPPVITLNGAATINLNIGQEFIDPGATALDNVSGDISSDIVIGGDNVNTSVAGTYVITYNVSDEVGNAAIEVTRTVIVTADTTAPVITLLGEATFNILIGSTFTDPGATATDNVDGDISENIVVAGDVVDTDIAGTYTITYNVSDAAGNAATQVTRTVNVSATDTVAPEITLIGDATININLGDSFTDPGATASDNVDGDITANIVVTGTVDVNTAGTYTLNYNVSDIAGNAADEVTRTVIVSEATSNDNLLVNGDFENGTEAWYGEALDVRTEGDNSYSFVNVASAGNPFDVNISQLVELTPGENYTLTFDASSDGNRTMIVGIGQSADPFYADTETVNLTTDTQTFTLELSAIDDGTSNTFGDATSRVLFDMGADVGVVVIDNVTLTVGGSGSGGGGDVGDGILTNGNFETGDATGWSLFANGGTAELDNTTNNGGSFSGKLATNGASNPGFKQERVGIGTVQAGDVVQVSFDHIGSATAPEGGVFNVLLFVERAEGEPGDPITHIFDPRPSLSGTWSTFTANYTIPGGASVTGGLSILIEAVCGGAPGCSVSANIDNVSIVLNP